MLFRSSEASDESADGQHLLQDRGYLGGTPNRVDLVMHNFVNDIPVAIQKTALLYGGEKVVFWAGLQGTLGVLIPLESRHHFKMLLQMQSSIRGDDEAQPMAGRDHLAFRGYYSPSKSVIDGDLIETFLTMPRHQQERLADALDGNWPVERVLDTIWNMRALYAF